MKTSTTRRAAQLVTMLVVLSALGGCAVYAPAPGYYYGDSAVYAPPPVYVAPPVYAGPPIFFDFGFSTWGGRSHYRGYHGWHGGRGRGYRR